MSRVVVALAILVGCGAPRRSPVPAPGPRDPEFLVSSQRLRATLARDGIALDTEPVINTCDSPDPDRNCARCDVVTVLDQIDPELVDAMAIAFARYPSSVRKVARIEHVAFCRAITYELGTDHGPAGLADPNTHRVFISVEYFRGLGRTDLTIGETVHHEVFHLLDYALQGGRWKADREWHALNPAGVAYHAPDPGTTTRPRGFVNAYALTDEMEDRASTFEYLMSRPDELCRLSEDDLNLARKVRLLWQRVARVEGASRLGVTAPCALKNPRPMKPARKGTRTGPVRIPAPTSIRDR